TQDRREAAKRVELGLRMRDRADLATAQDRDITRLLDEVVDGLHHSVALGTDRRARGAVVHQEKPARLARKPAQLLALGHEDRPRSATPERGERRVRSFRSEAVR